MIAPNYKLQRNWQSVAGFQKQLGALSALDSDITYYRGFFLSSQNDANLFYNPATGFPYNPNTFGRKFNIVSGEHSQEAVCYILVAPMKIAFFNQF